MIKILYGAPGSGKTHYVFERLKEDYENSILIVPEQQTVVCERLALEALPANAQLSFEVLNFSRLCNKYFREYGGLSYNYISSGMRSLFMWRALHSLDLSEYNTGGNEVALTPVMLSTLAELKSSGISADGLESAASKLEGNSPLKKKLIDIVEIYKTYDALVKTGFDDASDDLYKLCEIADKKKIFKGKKIYIDSFSSFTAPELALIKRMFSQADDVTVTLGCESTNINLICTESLKKTVEKLKNISGKEIECEYLQANYRTESPELRAINANLWSMGAVASVADSIPENRRGDVKIMRCRNAYSEADAVVNIIKEQVAKGLRYRDIVVIARDISAERGILDAALDEASIPYFLSGGSELAAKPVVKLVTTALRAKIYGFRSEDVIANLNTGLYRISDRDADLFCEYVNTWCLSGKRFLEEAWTMNPDGYTDYVSARGEKILASANSVRAELIGKLEQFFISLDAAKNVRGMCRAVFEYFESISLRESLAELADDELLRGRPRESADTLAVFNLILSVLDDIVTALGDEKLTADEFLRVFLLAISSAEIGAIPTRYDEVTLGSASLLRTDNVKCAILIGVNDDEFPRPVKDSGIFSGADKKELEKYLHSTFTDKKERTSEEFLYARRAMTCPSESLYLLYREATITGSVLRPSILIRRVQRLLNYEGFTKDDDFDKNTQKRESLDPIESIGSYASAINILPELGDTDEALALRELLVESGRISADRRISIPECSIDAEIAKDVFGKEMVLSQSQIDKYVYCAFRYYCENILRLRSSEKAEVGHDIMGTFVHSLLEEFLKLAVNGEEIDLSFPEGKTEETADAIIERLIDSICPPDKKESARMAHIFVKLRRVSLLILKNLRDEFRHSSFSPTYFELNINKHGDIEPLCFELTDGTKINLIGKIDRVDIMKKTKADGSDDVFVRIIDYKTGSKEFSFSDIKDGVNLQLLIYLFAVCRKNTRLSAGLGCKEDQAPLPAAAHYLSSKVSIKNLDVPMSEEDILEQTKNSFSRSGVYSGDPEILKALNSDLSKNMLDGIEAENGTFKGRGLVAPEEFAALENEVKDSVLRIAEEMRSGRADAASLSDRLTPMCDYCSMKAVCRNARKSYR